MANEEHIRVLEHGVAIWNKWREDNPDAVPDLSGMDLHNAVLVGANFRGTKMKGAKLYGANLAGADFCGADLRSVDAAGYRRFQVGSFTITKPATFEHSDLSGANLSDSDFTRAFFSGANFSRAELWNSNLTRADLRNCDLSQAEILYVVFGGNDLSSVKGLETIRHRGPSTIGLDTIYLSKGLIPEIFLRGCGVPDSFITYAKSLVVNAIEFYSCFISYSSKDRDFAERLYADLQNRNVRCWFAPQDLRIGDKFRQRIDDSIRLFDKLLLVLSSDSIMSAWVEDEVESALERERLDNRLVLFPVRIDDSVLHSTKAWAGSLRRQRHIGDFTDWKNHDFYQKAFARLLRDLKSDGAGSSHP